MIKAAAYSGLNLLYSWLCCHILSKVRDYGLCYNNLERGWLT